MPFGKWPDFNACKADMMGPPNNYDEEIAKKTCGKLQARLEGKELFRILKSKEGRRVIGQYVHIAELDLQKDIVPMPRIREALENMKTWNPRYQNVPWRHTSYQIGHPLWQFRDADGSVHKTEVDEYGLYGVTEIRNDGYQKADEVWSDILQGKPMGASIGVTSPDGKMIPIKLTKDEIAKRGLRKDWEGARYWDIPLQFIEPWSLTDNPANQYVTTATILAKDICEPCVKARAKWYLEKGICKTLTEALARARVFFEKYNEKELVKQDEKPPKDWWDACMANVTGADKAAVCGHIFHHTLGGDRSRADPSMFQKEMWKAIFKAMTWEECIGEAEKNPNVKDPEALCGWLRAHGPNAPKSLKQQECPEGKHWDDDAEDCVPDEVEVEEEVSKIMKSINFTTEEKIMSKYWKKP